MHIIQDKEKLKSTACYITHNFALSCTIGICSIPSLGDGFVLFLLNAYTAETNVLIP